MKTKSEKPSYCWHENDHRHRHRHRHLHLLVVGLVLIGLLCGVSRGDESTDRRTSPITNTAAISAMFVMGDSTVDCGDNTLFYSRLHRNLSLLPCDHLSLLPHLLAEKMALPPARPFYNQSGSVEELTGGVNFGSAQATIMGPGSQGYQSLNQQLRQASETVQLLHLGLTPPKTLLHFVRSSLFYLSFGKDDFVNNYNSAVDTPSASSSSGLARMLAGEMERAVRSLHDMKIRRIVCAGVLPVGCAPGMVGPGTGACSEDANEAVLEYNVMMEEKIMELNADFPDARIVFCDVYQGIREIISDPRRYGIEEVKRACCGMGKYGEEIGCVTEEMACNNTEAHLWWDQYNPTKAVNSLLADSAWSGHPFSGLCRPITIQQLVSSSPPPINTLF